MAVRLRGELYWLWRAVDDHGMGPYACARQARVREGRGAGEYPRREQSPVPRAGANVTWKAYKIRDVHSRLLTA